MKLLGISAYYHDSAAALIIDGEVITAVQEERFTRKKNDASFPFHSINFCLKENGLQLNDLDAIVFYDKPFLKFERIIQTVLEAAPKGLGVFLISMPIWLKEKLFLKSLLRKQFRLIENVKCKVSILFSTHHLAHAASAFYASPFQSAVILTIDGVGEWATASIATAEGNRITMLKQMDWPHSLGLVYAALTYFLGFKINEGEFKVMGLAPYANPDAENVRKYYHIITNDLVELHDDGSITLNPNYFAFTHSKRMINVRRWEKLFGMVKRNEKDPLISSHAELAFALQKFTEEVVQKMAAYAKKISGRNHLCLAGGVALNCVSNGKLSESKLFDNIFVQPAAGDAGGALGAALAANHLHFNQNRLIQSDFMKAGALGPAYSDEEILASINKWNYPYKYLSDDEMFSFIAAEIKNGKVIGWFNGRMEFGPRALGNRSILADAMNPEMQRILNLKIKKRESFRPFAPIILQEELSNYFEKAESNSYMMFVHAFKESKRTSRPMGFYDMTFSEMLQHAGTDLPAITHIDYTARIQVVNELTNVRLFKLLNSFKAISGVGVMINTSFNVKDEPIVCSPDDAIQCFLQTEMDILVLENFILRK